MKEGNVRQDAAVITQDNKNTDKKGVGLLISFYVVHDKPMTLSNN